MRIADQLSKLPTRAQRILALLMVPTVLLSIWAGVVWPIWHAHQAQVEWRANAVKLLAQRRGLTEIETAVRAQLDALPNLRSWQKLYHMARDESAAIALQTEVSAALTSTRARPQAFTPLEVTQVGPLRKVGVRIVIPMTIDQLKEASIRIGNLTHLVRIERLVVTAPRMQAANENPTLMVTMDVIGYAFDAATLLGSTGE